MENKGLIVKYDVRKVDNGELVNNCFVLRPDIDGAAVAALRKYAEVTTNGKLSNDITNWLDSIVNEKTKNLKAFAIGPDRYEVVVGYDKESVVAWYKQTTRISEEDWAAYEVSDYPMDKSVQVEALRGTPYETTTVREWVHDVKSFPCVAWWKE
ncbi:hypothetical protein HP567_012915 [Brevibacillus sp. M2.1A]|uniref:hypothetical protein n=1 Tax=Brevibacillus sp. M2.1A TaxID=2738980 RepID=UPI00156BD12A|nr:hypothetical protein [Brevibacillus sp. M2.1A]MCC8435446.1 hypothetical protein [Brevibacillus sp. M2.1A]